MHCLVQQSGIWNLLKTDFYIEVRCSGNETPNLQIDSAWLEIVTAGAEQEDNGDEALSL